jgi:hypothetical protein
MPSPTRHPVRAPGLLLVRVVLSAREMILEEEEEGQEGREEREEREQREQQEELEQQVEEYQWTRCRRTDNCLFSAIRYFRLSPRSLRDLYANWWKR